MEASKNRNIRSGIEYDQFFERAPGKKYTVKKNATLSDTVGFIPKVVHLTLNQTGRIAQQLKGRNTYETCSNIWYFIYNHIQYKKDESGREQIRSPRRTWHDRKQGVDCDCYSTFIASILNNLRIPHILRITKYKEDHFQHIYPIVPYNGRYITVDCVTNHFNYEVPFSEKKDFPMELQFLDGFDSDGMDDLGKIIQRNMAKTKKPMPLKLKAPIKKPGQPLLKKAVPALVKKITANTANTASSSSPAAPATPKPVSTGTSTPAVKKPKLFKKILNKVNKINPATVLLRNGILAAMKLNVKNVAARLRWSYLSPQQAAAKNIDPAKYQKLVATRQKLEKIFFGAGGKPDNLRKAILGGKGNKDNAASPGLSGEEEQWTNHINEYSSLQQLLGQEIYYSENVEGMEGFQGLGQLGEPISLTSIGAAMGVIAGIVASLKQIGDIFKTKQKGSEDFDESKTEAPENNVNAPASTVPPATVPAASTSVVLPANTSSQEASETYTQETVKSQGDELVKSSPEDSSPANKGSTTTETEEEKTSATTSTDNTGSGTNTDTTKENFWDKNKSWLKPVAIGVGGLTLIAIGVKVFAGKKNQNKSSPGQHDLSGIPSKQKNKNHQRKPKNKKKHNQKQAVALV